MSETSNVSLKKSIVAYFSIFFAATLIPCAIIAYDRIASGPAQNFDFDLIQAEARSVIAGIDAYSRAHGEYPPNLGALVPIYLKIVPAPSWGNEFWKYAQYPDHYELKLEKPKGKGTFESVIYNSATGWSHDE